MLIGGELAIKFNKDRVFYTGNGRSSLNLFLKSLKPRKILLPNFLCDVIIDTIKYYNIEFDYYEVNCDLTINEDKIFNSTFDVIYFINYFGKKQNFSTKLVKYLNENNKIVLEDNVFFYNFYNSHDFKWWYSFNSYRKIINIADGSLVKTNLDIQNSTMFYNSWSKQKYIAKEMKYNFIHNKIGNKNDYLQLFKIAENSIENKVYKISNESIYILSTYNFEKSQRIRKRRWYILKQLLKERILIKNVDEYSYVVIKLFNRNYIRESLFKKNIFLPIHWPKNKFINHSLYDNVISIPLFEDYSDKEFMYMIENIVDVIKKEEQ